MNKLFIDDVRYPADNSWIIVRSSDDAKEYIKYIKRIPDQISFDHDLGGQDTAMIFIHWLIEVVLDGEYKFPKNFQYKVHSANPVGSENIKTLMNNFINFVS